MCAFIIHPNFTGQEVQSNNLSVIFDIWLNFRIMKTVAWEVRGRFNRERTCAYAGVFPRMVSFMFRYAEWKTVVIFIHLGNHCDCR